MKGNKKLGMLSIALGLSIVTLFGSISAYFTDFDSETNEFVVGKVSLDLQEPNWKEPVDVMPSQTISKDPQVLNNGDNDEFVFLEVHIPVKNIITAKPDGTKNPQANTELFTYTKNEGWEQVGKDISREGEVIRIYAYAKDNECTALKPTKTTPTLFDEVTFCNAIEGQGLENTTQEMLVNAYGIQSTNINGGKTTPMDVWEVINNQSGIGVKPEEHKATLMNGSNFNSTFNKNFPTATSIQFIKGKAISDGVTTVDFSENQDGSILGWQEGDAVYISSEGRIMANEDCNIIFSVTRLKKIDFNNFDTSNVTDMSWMFYNCSSLTEIKGLENFNTSKVTNMEKMFYSCKLLTSLDVSNFDTSNVTTMQYMFYSCKNLSELDLSSFDTSNVTDMSSMFSACSNLRKLDVSNFNTTNVTTMSSMFSSCTNLQELDVSNFNTSNVLEMTTMFAWNKNLTKLDLSGFDTSKVEIMNQMFHECSNLTELNLSGFDTSKVETMRSMFKDCTKLATLKVSATDWVINPDTNITDMWSGCPIKAPTHKI